MIEIPGIPSTVDIMPDQHYLCINSKVILKIRNKCEVCYVPSLEEGKVLGSYKLT